MKKNLKVFAVVIAMSMLPQVAFAASPWVAQTTYSDQLRGKLDFGVKNLLAGWTQIFTEPMNYHKEGKCVIKGLGYGLYTAVADTVGGALHFVTFPITQIDVPLPDNGVSF